MVKANRAKFPTMKTLTEKGKKNSRSSCGVYIALSFFVPFALMAVAFAFENIAPFGIIKTGINYLLYQLSDLTGVEVYVETQNPFGDRIMHATDMWHQYFPFIVDLHDKLQSGGSLFWSWSVGLGVNFIAMMSYYLLSPLNFLSVLFETEALASYIAVATVIKIALAGMFTAICFKIIFKKIGLPVVFFSTMFALCSFNMGYYWNIIWLDSVAMLPLVVAGTVSLLRDGKYKLFIISLALAVVFNYYIGLFICVAVFLTAIGYTASCWHSLRKAAKDLLRTITCSAIALMLTALITIPAYLALQNCYKSSTTFPTGLDINIGQDTTAGIIDSFFKVFSNSLSFITPNDKEGLPNIGCGLLCLVMLGIFFCSKKIKKGEKIFCVATLLFFVTSFIFRRLDYMWHGFHYPNMIPYRFSFLYSFLIIYMAYRAYTLLKDSSYIDVIISTLVFSIFILLYFLRSYIEVEEGKKNYASFSNGIMTACIIIGSVMLVAILLYTLKFIPKRFLTGFICMLVIGEMGATAIIGVNTVTSQTRNDYPRAGTSIERLLGYIDNDLADEAPDLYRVESISAQTLNDGAFNLYPGASMFNSMANVTVNKYFGNMGGAEYLAGNRYTYYDSSPVTNILFNMRYLIATSGQSYAEPFVEEVSRSGNVILYENKDYINMGFLANPELESFEISPKSEKNIQSNDPEKAFVNPFENQMNFWQKATGITEPLYIQIPVSSTDHSTNPTVYADGCNVFYGDSNTVKYEFTVPEESYVYSYFYVSGAATGNGTWTVSNDEKPRSKSINVEQAHISAIGKVNENATITLDCTLDLSSWVRAYCYMLNVDVYNEGVKILKESTLNTTEATDTTLKGTINANRDGVLYTSIPYEKGWTVKVDGVEQEVIPLGVVYPDSKEPDNLDKAIEGGMCCVAITKGEHTIEFSYTPAGFKAGVVIFTTALVALIFFWICTSKKWRGKKFAKPVVWLFDPAVKEAPIPQFFFEDTTETEESEATDNFADFEDFKEESNDIEFTIPEENFDILEPSQENTASDISEINQEENNPDNSEEKQEE